MSLVYPASKGLQVRHYIESAESIWYATFESDANKVTYFYKGWKQRTIEEFVNHHHEVVTPPRDVWKECEIYHEGNWKRNPTTEQYIDLTQIDDDEEIVLEPI